MAYVCDRLLADIVDGRRNLQAYEVREVRGSEDRSDDRILHSTVTNNILLVASLLALRSSMHSLPRSSQE